MHLYVYADHASSKPLQTKESWGTICEQSMLHFDIIPVVNMLHPHNHKQTCTKYDAYYLETKLTDNSQFSRWTASRREL